MEYFLLNIDIFFLAFIRISGFFHSAPVLGSQSVPIRVRVALSLILTIVIFPFIPIDSYVRYNDYYIYIFIIIKEALIGILIGLVGNFVFEALRLSGQIMGVQIGFSMVNTIDPESQLSISIIGMINTLFATAIFIVTNTHLKVLRVMIKSFDMIKLGAVKFDASLIKIYLKLFTIIFIAAIKIAIPVLATLYIANLSLAFMARVAQKLNVFMLSFSLKILIGLSIFLIAFPGMLKVSNNLFKLYIDYSLMVLNSLR